MVRPLWHRQTRPSPATLHTCTTQHPLKEAWSCRSEARCPVESISEPFPPTSLKEQTGRLESLWATGCTILTAHLPTPDAALELRIYLPGLAWPLQVDQAKVTWGRSDVFTVEYLSLAVAEQLRLGDYLADYPNFFVDRIVSTRSRSC